MFTCHLMYMSIHSHMVFFAKCKFRKNNLVLFHPVIYILIVSTIRKRFLAWRSPFQGISADPDQTISTLYLDLLESITLPISPTQEGWSYNLHSKNGFIHETVNRSGDHNRSDTGNFMKYTNKLSKPAYWTNKHARGNLTLSNHIQAFTNLSRDVLCPYLQ